MLCIDTSSMIAFFEGHEGHDVDWAAHALSEQVAVFAPVTLTELLSDPKLPLAVRRLMLQVPILPVTEGFWERAGLLRAKVLARKRKARLADTLIAQSCLDNQATLITRDRDFEVFQKIARLRLI